MGKLTTRDLYPSDIFTYDLVSGDGDLDNSSFNILGDQMRTSAVFDYQGQNSFAVRVCTTDQGGVIL